MAHSLGQLRNSSVEGVAALKVLECLLTSLTIVKHERAQLDIIVAQVLRAEGVLIATGAEVPLFTELACQPCLNGVIGRAAGKALPFTRIPAAVTAITTLALVRQTDMPWWFVQHSGNNI